MEHANAGAQESDDDEILCTGMTPASSKAPSVKAEPYGMDLMDVDNPVDDDLGNGWTPNLVSPIVQGSFNHPVEV